jgi:hypothetical protein
MESQPKKGVEQNLISLEPLNPDWRFSQGKACNSEVPNVLSVILKWLAWLLTWSQLLRVSKLS